MSLLATVIAVASIAGLPAGSFRYQRELPAPAARGEAAFEPDSAMLAHTRPGFADLRIVDAGGSKVAWRERSQGGTAAARPALVHRAAVTSKPVWNGRRHTVLSLDIGHSGTPVSEVQLTAGGSADYDRPITISGSHDGRAFFPAGSGTITRTPGIERRSVDVDSSYRYLRVEVGNGDDEPLTSIDVALFGPSRALLVEPGHRLPLTMYYGAAVPAPDYEFARLPSPSPARVLPPSALAAEIANPAVVSKVEPEGSGNRNDWMLTAALALAALVVALSGIFVMSRNS